MPEAVDIIIEITRKGPGPMTFKISVKACFEEATGTTPFPSSESTASVYTPTGTTASVYTPTGTTASVYTPTASTSSSIYTGVSSVQSTSVYVTPTASESSSIHTSSQSGSTSSVYGTPTTVCTVEEGMDEPKFIPDRNIRDKNNRVPENVDRLRPRNRRPYTVDTNTVTIRFLFEPAIPVESLKLINPDNVDSIEVTYISPRRPNQEVPVVEVIITLFNRSSIIFKEVSCRRMKYCSC
jgi:hypothetical protein